MKRKPIVMALVLMVSFGIVLGLTSCGSGNGGDATGGNAAIVGEWRLSSAEIGGQTIDKSQLEDSDYAVIFSTDGTSKVNVMGQSYDAVNYTVEDGTVVFDREGLSSFIFKLDGNNLVCESPDGARLIFEKG